MSPAGFEDVASVAVFLPLRNAERDVVVANTPVP
jgi:hypothetical protein